MSGFTLETRVSEALAERPELRQILPAFHPAFDKLNHPVMGKIMPRLVTLAQAARVAGVDADALVEVCNLPGPPAAPPPEAPRRMDPPPPWPDTLPVVVVDTGPLMDRGEEPFSAIMAALREAPEGAVVRVLAPFEPAPLVALLGKRGWVPHVTWDGETCVASFWRAPAAQAGDPDGELAPLLDARLKGDTIDVRGLEPPWPLRLVLAATEQVLPLTVLHQRQPALLFPRLEQLGLVWTVAVAGDVVTITIDRAAR